MAPWHTGTGFSGTGGAVGGILANLAIGYVVSRFSYLPVFLIAAVLHPLGWLLIHFLLVEVPPPDPSSGATDLRGAGRPKR